MSAPSDLLTGISHEGLAIRRLSQKVLRLVPYSLFGRRDSPAMIVFPAPGFGSLGDQAMWLSAMNGLRNKGYRHIGLVVEHKPSRYEVSSGPDSVHDYRKYFNGSALDSFRFQFRLAASKGFFVLGADTIDGYYSPAHSLKRIYLLHLAASLGLTSRVFGFSFNEQPADEVVEALRNLPTNVDLLARDPVSHRRLETALERPIRLVADLAFLLKPEPCGPSSRATIDWIDYQRSHGAKVVGINSNAHLVRSLSNGELCISVSLAKLLINLHAADPDLRFVMIPHDFRGKFNDGMLNDVAVEIACFAKEGLRQKIFSMPRPCSAAEVKAVCGKLDFAISGRMHLAIACLGQGTPAVCIGYQGKMEGLFEHFGLENMTISPSQFFNGDEMVNFAKEKLSQTLALRAHIGKRLPNVIHLAKKNFT